MDLVMVMVVHRWTNDAPNALCTCKPKIPARFQIVGATNFVPFFCFCFFCHGACLCITLDPGMLGAKPLFFCSCCRRFFLFVYLFCTWQLLFVYAWRLTNLIWSEGYIQFHHHASLLPHIPHLLAGTYWEMETDRVWARRQEGKKARLCPKNNEKTLHGKIEWDRASFSVSDSKCLFWWLRSAHCPVLLISFFPCPFLCTLTTLGACWGRSSICALCIILNPPPLPYTASFVVVCFWFLAPKLTKPLHRFINGLNGVTQLFKQQSRQILRGKKKRKPEDRSLAPWPLFFHLLLLLRWTTIPKIERSKRVHKRVRWHLLCLTVRTLMRMCWFVHWRSLF